MANQIEEHTVELARTLQALRDDESRHECEQHADEALHQAKREGRNRVVVIPGGEGPRENSPRS